MTQAHPDGMGKDSPYQVPLKDLEAVHIAVEDMVEEHDTSPPVPDAKSEGDRTREALLRVGAPGL